MDPKEITYEMVNKKLQEIVLSRGKKGIDRQDQVEMLSYLATVAKGPYQKVLRQMASMFLVTLASDVIQAAFRQKADAPPSKGEGVQV